MGGDFRRIVHPVQMPLQGVEVTVNTFEGLKNPVPPVDQMIVHRDHHQRRVGDNSAKPARIHGPVMFLVRFL